MLNWLENWYLKMCDGDWEHNYGITIKTIDNLGWDITIDLADTGVAIEEEEWKYFEESETQWYGYKIKNNVFEASGDPKKLNFLVALFKEKIEQNKK